MSFFDQKSDVSGLLGGGQMLPDYMAGINQALQQNAQTPQPKRDFFGEGGTGRNIAGLIGDYLAQLGGMQPIYGPQMAQRKQMEQQQQQYEKRRQDELADWQAKQQWEQANKQVASLPCAIRQSAP